jgi:hypothetical protein
MPTEAGKENTKMEYLNGDIIGRAERATLCSNTPSTLPEHDCDARAVATDYLRRHKLPELLQVLDQTCDAVL